MVESCLKALLSIGFAFDSVAYLPPLKFLIERGFNITQLSVIENMVRHKLSLDTQLLQRSIQASLEHISDDECKLVILRIIRLLVEDPSKYLTLDFIRFILSSFLEHNL